MGNHLDYLIIYVELIMNGIARIKDNVIDVGPTYLGPSV